MISRNKLRLEPDVKYKGQHRSACTAVTRAVAVTFSFGIIAIAVARAFEKLAGGPLSALGSAPAFSPRDVAATKGRVETINGIENSQNTPFTFASLSRSLLYPSCLYFSQIAGKPGRARGKAKY